MSKMDDEGDGDLLNRIRQYQNSIIKHSELGNDAKILGYIKKLYDMRVTVEHLQETGIGRTINSLRKYSGDVGHASRAIVSKWKTMVAQQEVEEEQTGSGCKEPEEPRRSPSPSPSPPPAERKKSKTEDKHETKNKERRSESKDKSSRKSDTKEKGNRSQSEDTSSRSKSHHKREEKSSQSREKEHRSHGDSESKHRREDKSRHDKKRKHEDEPSPAKKKKYDSSDQDSDASGTYNGIASALDEYPDSLNQSDENHQPDSTTACEDYRENTQSPIEKAKSSSRHKKHHKSDKHRSHSDEKKEVNGSHSSKKSSHEERKHSSDKSKKEKSSSSSSSKKPEDSKSKSSKSSSSNKSKKGMAIDADEGIDSSFGASFAEALGMIGPASGSKSNKKKTVHSASASPTPSTSKSSKPAKPTSQSPLAQNTNLLSPNVKLEPLELNIPAQLPEITTNYKPLGHYTYDSSPLINHSRHQTDEEALEVVISSKTQRTKVFSGNKTNWGFVPTLFNICVRVLQDNIDALEYTGGVPYLILKPVLERATPNQLLNTEYHNPYLVEESDELWELHCKRECRGMQRQEMESWRDMYLRCRDERDAKLKALTVNIKQSIDKSLPVRQTKLAYVDSVVKPPRGIARKQAKYGTDKRPAVTPSSRLSAIASSSGGERVSVPSSGVRAALTASSGGMIKPKKAPLMQKALALIKSRFRR